MRAREKENLSVQLTGNTILIQSWPMPNCDICLSDHSWDALTKVGPDVILAAARKGYVPKMPQYACLLYTSDAADE